MSSGSARALDAPNTLRGIDYILTGVLPAIVPARGRLNLVALQRVLFAESAVVFHREDNSVLHLLVGEITINYHCNGKEVTDFSRVASIVINNAAERGREPPPADSVNKRWRVSGTSEEDPGGASFLPSRQRNLIIFASIKT